MIRTIFILSLILTPLSLGKAGDTYAQGYHLDSSQQTFRKPPPGEDTSMFDAAPIPPRFEKVKFFDLEPALTLQEKVDRLVHGITTDIEPKYDHYGYEIRRYMADIGDLEKLNDPVAVEEHLNKVKKAKIILKYWNRKLQKDIKAAKQEIEETGAPSTVWSRFRYNKAVVNTFIIEMENWLNNNRNVLDFLEPRAEQFNVEYPKVYFDEMSDGGRFYSLYRAREKSLEQVRKYMPFSVMIY